jgi:hypothetical protein
MLRGFDDYVNMVLEDVTEFELSIEGGYKVTKSALHCSKSTPPTPRSSLLKSLEFALSPSLSVLLSFLYVHLSCHFDTLDAPRQTLKQSQIPPDPKP